MDINNIIIFFNLTNSTKPFPGNIKSTAFPMRKGAVKFNNPDTITNINTIKSLNFSYLKYSQSLFNVCFISLGFSTGTIALLPPEIPAGLLELCLGPNV